MAEQTVSSTEAGVEFILGDERYVRLDHDQWVHAIYHGNDITPNVLRLRDGVLMRLRSDCVVPPKQT